MSEEIVEVQEPVELTVEDRAREQGWKPKEEYEGDSSKWVSAETFVAKGELIEKIEALSKELKGQKKANQMLLEHHDKVKKSEFDRAVAFLKSQKKRAYEDGDVDKVIEIDEQLLNVRDTQKLQAQAVQAQEDEPHPNFVAWTSQNKWYNQDSDLREEADTIGLAHSQRYPNKTPEEVLSYVEKQIKKMYPEKFTNPNRSKPTAVEGASAPVSRSTSSFELSDDEKRAMMTFVRSGIMTKEQYISDLKSIKGMK